MLRYLSLAAGLAIAFSGIAHGQVPIGSCKQTAAVSAVTFSPDGKTIATGAADNSIRLWDATTYKEQRNLPGMQSKVTAILYSPDGKSLVAGCQTGMVSVWDTGTHQQRLGMHSGRGSATALALSPDGRQLASGGEDRRIFLRDITNGLFHRVYNGHGGNISGLAFSPDGRQIASAGGDRSIRIWDATNGQENRRIEGKADGFQAVAFAPDGKRLVSAAKEVLQVWDPSNGNEIAKVSAHKGMVTAVVYSKDGKMVATCGEDGGVCLWDPTTGKLLRRLGQHQKAARALAFAPGIKALASVGDDGQLLLWDTSPRIFLPAKPVDLTEKDLDKLWEALAGTDFAKAGEAIGTMAASKQSIPFLSQQLKKIRPEEDEKRIAKLIIQLDDDQFTVRERATTDLERLGPVAVPHLQLSLKGDLSLEARRRAERVLEKAKSPELTPDQYRLQRAVAALELTNNADARKLLDDLAKGAGGAWLALEAKSSLDRMERK
ncbi:hypothetical protein AYO40_06680 [Planctomycetaceae bacterium SCGC AG-212-D15]|nr:hypothetical protein AYO40_06680 [Planctomycetaceae bacterium SCGC AG-212-D15]